MLYIVTIRLGKDPVHDPKRKLTGMCRAGDERCTDSTGEHHSFLVDSEVSLDEVRDTYAKTYHVTRVETAKSLDVV